MAYPSKNAKKEIWALRPAGVSKTDPHLKNVGGTSTASKHVFKTVYNPNQQANTLALEIEMLNKQIEQGRVLFDAQVKAYEEDEVVRNKESDLRHQLDLERI